MGEPEKINVLAINLSCRLLIVTISDYMTNIITVVMSIQFYPQSDVRRVETL